MVGKKRHFRWSGDRYTACGIDTWHTWVMSTEEVPIVSCKRCLKRLGFE